MEKKNYDVCAPHRKKFGSCCFKYTTLKMMIKDLYKKYEDDDDEQKKYRPGTKYGGDKKKNDHRTRKGMAATVKEFAKGKPQEQWINIEPWKSNEILTTAMGEELNPPSDAYKDSQWLSTWDIDLKLEQFSRYYRWRFSSLGARSSEQKNVPNIHLQSSKDICKKLEKDWKNRRRYSSFGFVLNVNKEHWVAIFFRRHSFIIEYFDSKGTALAVYPRAVNIIEDLQKKLHEISKQEWKLVPPKDEKEKKKQEENNECGMFALYYIEQRLRKKSRESILNDDTKLNDKYVCSLRKKSFRKKVKTKKNNDKKRIPKNGNSKANPIVVDE